MPAPTTLVLGAGASCNYGFPTGHQLRATILGSDPRDPETQDHLFGSANTIRAFVNAFRLSGQYSIDAFLGRRGEFSEIGKRAIARALLTKERAADLFADGTGDHWYQYLLNLLARVPWEEFNPSWLSVVTFNYDRSLETYLLHALTANYHRPQAEVLERLRQIRIVHVYGSLGSPWPDTDGHLEFGRHATQRQGRDEESLTPYITIAANNIRVIPEGRDDAPEVRQAQDLLRGAHRIAFLGFGFDSVNVRRLGAPAVFDAFDGKMVTATWRGLTEAERRRAGVQLRGPERANQIVWPEGDCLRALRETLILEAD